MASFCAKCGAALSADGQSCTACGAPAVTAGSFAAPAQPFASQSAATPAKSGNSAVKIILIIVAIVVGLGILGLGIAGYTALRISRALHVSGSGDQVSMSTAGGTFSANSSETFTTEELGTDPYPGAQSIRGGMKLNLPNGLMVTGVFLTSDSKNQVLEFYKDKLGAAASVDDSTNRAVVNLNREQRESIVVTISTNLSNDNGKTRITILHTKTTKAG